VISVAFLGLGRMGRPMAANLVRRGHDLVVWNRTASTATAFVAEHGGRAAPTPSEAVRNADVVISMMADDDALLDTYLGLGEGLTSLRDGALVVDMSTISPATVATLSHALADREIELVDAPVSGSVAAATAATLTIMAGGNAEAVERARPVLSDLGTPVLALGPSGSGSAMKLAVNAVLHSLNGAVSEALVMAEHAGIERSMAYQIFLESAIAAPFVRYRQESFENPSQAPVAFRLELAAKDLRLALAAADSVGANLPQTRANLELLMRAVADGFADADETALAEYLREQSSHRHE
jgi:3-hydroxyisobutyrate dehydrogenase-like beta-hydroxyacid dehydrogenase